MLPTALCVLVLWQCTFVSSFLSASYFCNDASIGSVLLYESSVTLSTPSILEQASMIAIETTKLSRGRASKSSSPATDVDGSELKTPTRVKKVKPVKLSPTEMTGYNYSDGRELFDVPFINEPLWYRVLVRKGSESTVCESLLQSVKKGGQWAGSVVDAFYPRLVSYSFQRSKKAGKGLAIVSKPMIPGVVFVKMQMNPDLADDMESSSGVNRFATNEFNLVVPLDEVEAEEIAVFQQQPAPTIDEEMSLLQIGEYVSVVDGQHKGKYGIIEGTRSGDIQVRLRSEYRDSIVNIDVHHLRYLQEPPEVNYKTMTAKQAVESLMVKEPDSDMLKFLRREGLLKDILNPEVKMRREQQLARRQSDSSKDSGDRWNDRQKASDDAVPDSDRPSWQKREMLSGRDGGRSQSSISVNRKQPNNINNNNNNKSYNKINQLARNEEPRNVGMDADNQNRPWKRVAAQQTSSPVVARRWPSTEGDDSSSPRSATAGLSPQKEKEEGMSNGDGEDFDSFIERMLSEADNEQRSKQTPSNPSAARTDTKKDGRRGKGVDYSSTTGGSSASTVDNEDFESFLDRMLSEYEEGEDVVKKTGNKSPSPTVDRRGQQGVSSKGTSPVPVVREENKEDVGFSFDWLDGSSGGNSIDQTLDELLNTPLQSKSSSDDLLFSENYSIAFRGSREVNGAAASFQGPLRGKADDKAVPRQEKPRYSTKEKGSRTSEINGDASRGSNHDNGADRVIGTSKRRLYNGQKEGFDAVTDQSMKAAVSPNIDDYASFEDYFNALVASNVPSSSVYYDASTASSRSAGNRRSTTVQRSDRERQQQQPIPSRSNGDSGSAEVIVDMRTSSSVEFSLDNNAMDKSVVQTRAGVDIETLSKLSVKELKAQCKERQLPMTGLKADLIAKLIKSQE